MVHIKRFGVKTSMKSIRKAAEALKLLAAPPHDISVADVARALRVDEQAHAAVLGATPPIEGVPYGSDLRLFTNHARLPAVLYGPGEMSVAHTVDEWIDLEEVVTATKIVAGFITRWVGSAARD